VTDKEALCAMLDRAGVKYTPDNKQRAIDVFAGGNVKNEGYDGFYAAFYFKADESLDSVGIWE
jgi:hypothetical protein